MRSRGRSIDINDLAKALWKEVIGLLTHPAEGVGIVREIGATGYRQEEEQMENAEKLRALGAEVVSNPAFVQAHGKTHCNRAARFLCEAFGHHGFTPNDLANAMIAKMGASFEWRERTMEEAHAHAMKGGLAFLAVEDEPNGHLAAIMPEPMQESGSWGCPVPMVANVGIAPNAIKKASQAFLLAHKPGLRAFLYGDAA